MKCSQSLVVSLSKHKAMKACRGHVKNPRSWKGDSFDELLASTALPLERASGGACSGYWRY
jgi:hypothetical protein